MDEKYMLIFELREVFLLGLRGTVHVIYYPDLPRFLRDPKLKEIWSTLSYPLNKFFMKFGSELYEQIELAKKGLNVHAMQLLHREEVCMDEEGSHYAIVFPFEEQELDFQLKTWKTIHFSTFTLKDLTRIPKGIKVVSYNFDEFYNFILLFFGRKKDFKSVKENKLFDRNVFPIIKTFV